MKTSALGERELYEKECYGLLYIFFNCHNMLYQLASCSFSVRTDFFLAEILTDVHSKWRRKVYCWISLQLQLV